MYNREYNQSGRVPYDNEPISRETPSDGKKKKRSKMSGVDIFQSLLCIVLLVAIGLLSFQIKDIQKQRGIYNINVQDAKSEFVFATAKGMLSTVCVGASQYETTLKSENEFLTRCNSLGSGVVYSVDLEQGSAYIITNNHVIYQPISASNTTSMFSTFWVLFSGDNTPVKAELVGGSEVYDIAVLRITNSDVVKKGVCQAMTVSDSTKLVKGEACLAIGNPRGLGISVTSGKVSIEEMVFSKAVKNNGYSYVNLMHSSETNTGNSGGGLYNAKGEFIGIVNAKAVDVYDENGELVEVVHGMYFAIPSSVALSVAKNLMRNNGVLKKPDIGLNLVWVNKYGYLEGSYDYTPLNLSVTEDGARALYSIEIIKNSGQFQSGDKLVSLSYSFGGQTITDNIDHISSIDSHIYNWSVGTEVTFVVERLGSKKTIVVNVNSVTNIP